MFNAASSLIRVYNSDSREFYSKYYLNLLFYCYMFILHVVHVVVEAWCTQIECISVCFLGPFLYVFPFVISYCVTSLPFCYLISFWYTTQVIRHIKTWDIICNFHSSFMLLFTLSFFHFLSSFMLLFTHILHTDIFFFFSYCLCLLLLCLLFPLPFFGVIVFVVLKFY